MADARDCPPFTVGIPTVARNSLESTLASVNEASAAYEAPISVIVASSEKPPNLEENALTNVASVRWIRTTGTAHASRQAIVEESTTDWILFTDDDCKFETNIFSAYATKLRKLQDEDIGALYGRIEFAGSKSLVFAASQSLGAGPFEIGDQEQEVKWAPTANALMSRKHILDIGGFDTSNPVPVSGGDVDIGLRLTQADFSAYTTPDAVVYHTTETWNSIVENLYRFFRYGRSEAWLVDKYPNLRIKKWGRKEIFEASIYEEYLPWFLRPFPLPFWHEGWEDEPNHRLVLILILAELFMIVNSFGYHLQVLLSNRATYKLLFYRFRLPLPWKALKD